MIDPEPHFHHFLHFGDRREGVAQDLPLDAVQLSRFDETTAVPFAEAALRPVAQQDIEGLGGFVVGFGLLGFWWGGRRYDTWRWRLDGDLIEAHWGVLWRHTRLVPRHRVQTVSTDSGPIDRRLGLRTLTVHTAGLATPNLSIPHLTEDEITWIRAELTGEKA